MPRRRGTRLSRPSVMTSSTLRPCSRALERRRDELHRVEHRRIAIGFQRVERARHLLVIAGPRNRQPYLVREGGEEHLVARIEALDEKLERTPRVSPPRIVCRARFRIGRHAAADVEQNAKAHRHALRGELRNRPALAGVGQLELIGGQSAHETPRAIRYRDRHSHDVGAGAKDREGLRE